MAKKPNLFVHFLGKSIARKSTFGFISPLVYIPFEKQKEPSKENQKNSDCNNNTNLGSKKLHSSASGRQA
jgi:hypothetical protein